jgi:hypothetical protein
MTGERLYAAGIGLVGLGLVALMGVLAIAGARVEPGRVLPFATIAVALVVAGGVCLWRARAFLDVGPDDRPPEDDVAPLRTWTAGRRPSLNRAGRSQPVSPAKTVARSGASRTRR